MWIECGPNGGRSAGRSIAVEYFFPIRVARGSFSISQGFVDGDAGPTRLPFVRIWWHLVAFGERIRGRPFDSRLGLRMDATGGLHGPFTLRQLEGCLRRAASRGFPIKAVKSVRPSEKG